MTTKETERCPNCRGEYKALASHWRLNSNCYFPSLSQKQWDIVIGLYLTGCSTVTSRHSAAPYLQVTDTNKELLDWLDDELGKISRGVRVSQDEEYVQERAEDRGVRSPEKFETVYQLETRSHPHLAWLDVIAKNMRLPTPLSFEVIFSRRGSVNRTGYVSFGVKSLRFGKEFWEYYFSKFDATYAEQTLRVSDLVALERFLGYTPIHENYLQPFVWNPSVPQVYRDTEARIDAEGKLKCPSCATYVRKDVEPDEQRITLACSNCRWKESH